MAEIMTIKLETADEFLPVKSKQKRNTGLDTEEKKQAESANYGWLVQQIPGVSGLYQQANGVVSQVSGISNTYKNSMELIGAKAGGVTLTIALTALKFGKMAYDIWYSWDKEMRNTRELQRRSGNNAYFRRKQ